MYKSSDKCLVPSNKMHFMEHPQVVKIKMNFGAKTNKVSEKQTLTIKKQYQSVLTSPSLGYYITKYTLVGN